MKKTALRRLAWVGFLPLVLSCNVYKPLASPGNDEEYRQAALSCLHEDDFGCAIDNYNKLSDTDERDQNLCQVNLAQAGMTLVALVNVVSDKNSGVKVIGALANQLLPYSADKLTAANDAVTKCNALVTTGTRAKLNNLLAVISYFVRSATFLAKTTQIQCTVGDTTTTGSNNSEVRAADISPDASGNFNSSKAMCDTDANTAAADIFAAYAKLTNLQSNGFDQIATNLDAVRALFSTNPGSGAAAAVQARSALRGTATN